MTKTLGRLKAERSELIKQRTILLTKDVYDELTRDELEPRINQLSELISRQEAEKSDLKQSVEDRIVKFTRFLELTRNLDLYWKNANFEKKAIFSRIVFLNLKIRGSRLAKLRVKKPLSEDENGLDRPYGAAQGERLEPFWRVFTEPKLESEIE